MGNPKPKSHSGSHELNCSGGVLQARYRDTVSGRFDGIHMYGPSGQKAYTASVMKILRSAQLVKNSPPKYYDELDHRNCPQARYQAKQVTLRNSTGGMRNSTRGNSTGDKKLVVLIITLYQHTTGFFFFFNPSL